MSKSALKPKRTERRTAGESAPGANPDGREGERGGQATPMPEAVVRDWLNPFLEYLEKERRYSPYTVRNYRQALEDFYRWLVGEGQAETVFGEARLGALGKREVRDFVIEAQRRFDRRTLHNHVSGRSDCSKMKESMRSPRGAIGWRWSCCTAVGCA
jgi:integrase